MNSRLKCHPIFFIHLFKMGIGHYHKGESLKITNAMGNAYSKFLSHIVCTLLRDQVGTVKHQLRTYFEDFLPVSSQRATKEDQLSERHTSSRSRSILLKDLVQIEMSP